MQLPIEFRGKRHEIELTPVMIVVGHNKMVGAFDVACPFWVHRAPLDGLHHTHLSVDWLTHTPGEPTFFSTQRYEVIETAVDTVPLECLSLIRVQDEPHPEHGYIIRYSGDELASAVRHNMEVR